MRLLILGGTAWLGRTIARAALQAGHAITCVARGQSGTVPEGARLEVMDRDAVPSGPNADDPLAALADHAWDLVIDLTRQPGQARRAVAVLGPSTRHWVLVSSISVYADTGHAGQDEEAATVGPLVADLAGPADYAAAKRACELAVLAATARGTPQRALLARVGLIGGPGDPTGRSLYWPQRFARPSMPDGRVLVPDEPMLPTQLIDVRDLAQWLLHAGERGLEGVFNVCGDSLPLADHLRIAARVGREVAGTPAGHTAAQTAGDTAGAQAVSAAWLTDHGVTPWAGPRSLPLWVPRPSHDGFGAFSNARAKLAGLRLRPLHDTLADTLAWAEDSGQTAWPLAGLSPDDERALLTESS